MKITVAQAVKNVFEIFRSKSFAADIALTTISRSKCEQTYPSDYYSLLNRLILRLHGENIAMGYKAWNSFNRYVKSGSKAIQILSPCTKKIKAEESNDGKEHVVLTGFRFIPVFGYSSTDGEPLNVPDYTPEALPPYIDVAEHLGIKVKWKPVCRNAYGWYSPYSSEITMCSEDWCCYFHELAHAVHNQFESLANLDTDYCECVAETTAAVLCELNSVKGYHHQSYEYIREFTKDKTDKATLAAISNVLNMVEKIVTLVIETADKLASQKHEI